MDLNLLKEELLAHLDVEELLSELLPDFEAEGNNTACPMAGTRHKGGQDARPSLAVSSAGKVFCHSCGWKSSSIIGVYCDLKGMKFMAAIKELWARYVEPIVPESHVAKCRERLKKELLVQKRLEVDRAIPSKLWDKFELGWDGYRLTIPIRNRFGFCVNVRRYDILKREANQPKLVSFAKGYGAARLWPVDNLSGGGPAVIVEGEMDALCAIGQGLRAVSPTIGAATWKEEWSAAFKGQDVILLPDIDKAGLEGADKRKEALADQARSVQIIKLPLKGGDDGKDYTDWVVKHGGRHLPGKNGSTPSSAVAQEEVYEDRVPRKTKAQTPSIAIKAFEHKTPAEELNIKRAAATVRWLDDHGAFIRNQDNELFYALEGGKPVRVSDKSEQFQALLSSKVDRIINSASSSGRFVIRHVISHGVNSSAGSVSGSLSMYNNGAIYMYCSRDSILKAKEGKLEILKNGINDDGILLECPDYYVEWDPVLDADPGKAVQFLWSFVARFFPVSLVDKYLVSSWFFGGLLKEYVTPKPLLRLVARTAYGKSTMSKLLSHLLYGAEILQQSATTSAAIYALSRKYPLLILDNIETRNMTQGLEDFLINAATGGGKWKRQLETDTAVIREQTNCLVVTNGIEPINKHELISRTLEVNLDITKHGVKPFHETQIFSAIAAHRGYILSGMLKALSMDAVSRMKAKEVQRIANEFGGHSKDRFDEYFGLMSVVLDVIWKYCPSPVFASSKKLVSRWLTTQTTSSNEQNEETNDVLYFLEELLDSRGTMVDTKMAVDKTTEGALRMRGSTRHLLSDFRLLAKKMGIKCPWQSERHLGSRITDAEQVLKKKGWSRRLKLSGGRYLNEFIIEVEHN